MASSISGIGASGSSNLSSILQALRNAGIGDLDSPPSTSSQAINAQGDTRKGVDISQLSSFLSKLENLKTTNPDKYKQILSDFANKLRDLAKQIAGGTTGANATASAAGTTESGDSTGLVKMLNDMAARFDKAAQTGDVSQLLPQQQQPQAPPQQSAGVSGSGYGQYHHHHHGGAGASAASATSATGSTGSDAVSQLQTLFEQLTQEVSAA